MGKEILGMEIHEIWLIILGTFFFTGILVLFSMIHVGSSWMWSSLAVISSNYFYFYGYRINKN